jgi:hypothetical protein
MVQAAHLGCKSPVHSQVVRRAVDEVANRYRDRCIAMVTPMYQSVMPLAIRTRAS